MIRGMFFLRSKAEHLTPSGACFSVSLPQPTTRESPPMRTFLISYDLANPAQNKHAIAQSIMSAGERWARPLESTWYLTSSADEASLAERFGPLLDTDDGLLIQSVDDQAVLTNTSLRWFRQRRQPATEMAAARESNIVAFPAPKPDLDAEPELPFAKAS